MNIKKFLEKVAEEDRESKITEKDKEFLSSIGVDYNKKIEAAKKEPEASYYLTADNFNYKALLITVACFILVALIITISLYFSLKPDPITPPIHYFDDNFVSVDSDLHELNADLELFSLTVDESEYDLTIKKTYDSLSGDNLFYTINFTGLNQKFKFDIVVNKFYTHDNLTYTEELKEAQISEEYTIKYMETSKAMGGGMPLVAVTIMGEMQIGEQWIYVVKYEERAFGKSTFIETLESLINFK